MKFKSKNNYTYILLCKDNTLYTGYTNNLESRVEVHNKGAGAKYTRGRLPVHLVYSEAFDTKEEAMKKEHEIKHLTRDKKLKLISNSSI